MHRKLKNADEIRVERERLLAAQGGRDPIAGIKILDPVLDHDHSSGKVRCTLQREVNAFEGKVQNAYRRYIRHLGVPMDKVLRGLIAYYKQDFSDAPLHPRHRTENDKLRKVYRARIKKAKRPEIRAKYRALIKDLKD